MMRQKICPNFLMMQQSGKRGFWCHGRCNKLPCCLVATIMIDCSPCHNTFQKECNLVLFIQSGQAQCSMQLLFCGVHVGPTPTGT
mmetsp:Transcript_127087/g.290791  ORF Transcript_127087/g.290791 Transcript_127087/m.290791 type:complete len:85 (+) Transcript_127087:232-486(+)